MPYPLDLLWVKFFSSRLSLRRPLQSLKPQIIPLRKEILKLKAALAQAAREIQALVDQLKSSGRQDQAEIFEAHLLMVEDPEIIDPAFELIENQKLTASAAYKLATDRVAEVLSQIEDEYLSARAADVRDISQRVLQILSGKKP